MASNRSDCRRRGRWSRTFPTGSTAWVPPTCSRWRR
jgi:hypothetical protein